MIWHLLEVWALLAVMFALGCVLGALLYGAIARGPLAAAQGVLADAVGDVLERLKVRAGLAPAWRTGRMRRVERTAPSPQVRVEPRLAGWAAGDPSSLSAMPYASADAPPVELPVSDDDRARQSSPSASGEMEQAGGPVGRSSSAMHVADDGLVPKRPPGLSGPRGGAPDNLQRIKGIGRRNEAMLNSLGIYHFGQIAAWTPAEIRWIGQYLAYPERIERDDWPGQATLIAMGQDTGFEKSADRRRRRRREAREFASRMEHAVETDALAAAIGPPRQDSRPEPALSDDPYATATDEVTAETVPDSAAVPAAQPEMLSAARQVGDDPDQPVRSPGSERGADEEKLSLPSVSAEGEALPPADGSPADTLSLPVKAPNRPAAKAAGDVVRRDKNRKARHRRRVRKKDRPD